MSVDLDLSSFEAAIDRLGEVVAARQADPKSTFLRDAAIQRFKVNYELSQRMLRRFLATQTADSQAIEQMPFPDLIQRAHEEGLLRSDWDSWCDWLRTRGNTSRAYDEEVARQIAAVIPEFLLEARHLYEQMRLRSR